ncbi:methyl-accepting chemotaxis protein [Thermosediminibacter oceani]|uniref:Methyl-accepting chemotaxis sensory transducer with Cache sensor n=1 Tax=Thermosediminibacter oceani (strain ATCC BAA-1034 / DSM 16646 / JW/IW-1228P) TaxID=555079 RepID=D9S1G9_THEOJ|nr:methyl-accepting chemotaxis protein [Thermosediminibacter oceani]ADL07246.1 methyl-accepting chemotaxis sensory transducer with Cache sensor [Thermosediminibacter oceani DSM 16646]
MKKLKGIKISGGIRTRLTVLFLLISLVPLIVLSFFNYSTSKNNLTHAADRELLGKAVSAASVIDLWVSERMEILETLAENPVIKSGNLESLIPILKTVQPAAPDVQLLWYATPDGKVYSYLNDDITKPITDINDRQYFKEIMSTGKTTVSELVIDKVTGDKILVIVAPVKGQGGITGIVGADVNANALINIINSVKYGTTGYAFLVDKMGTTIAHPDEKMVMNMNITKTESESLNRVGERMIKGEEATVRYEYSGEYKLAAFSPVKNTGWSLCVTASSDEVYAGLKSFFWSTITLILVVTVIVIAAAVVFSRQLSSPILKLTAVADTLATGDLRVEVPEGFFGELGTLGSSLKKMLENTKTVLGFMGTAIANLEKAIREISQGAQDTAQAAEQVAETVSQISAGAQDMAQNTGNISAAVEDTTTMMQALVENLESITQNTMDTVKRTEQGEKIMKELSQKLELTTTKAENIKSAMTSLIEQAKEIAGITDVITGIAEQTNLLALNAAIEAARAGEAGRGFAVVAEEIRKLAEQSSQQASQITKIVKQVTENINLSNTATEEAVVLIEEQAIIGGETMNHFAEISAGARRVADLLSDIEKKARSVSEHSRKISEEVSNAAAISEENAASSQEIAASAQEMSSAAQTISASTTELINLVEKLKEASAKFIL